MGCVRKNKASGGARNEKGCQWRQEKGVTEARHSRASGLEARRTLGGVSQRTFQTGTFVGKTTACFRTLRGREKSSTNARKTRALAGWSQCKHIRSMLLNGTF